MSMLILLTAARAEEAAAPGFTLYEILMHSGPVAWAVLAILTLMLIAVVIVTIERLMAFGAARKQSKQLAAEVVPFLQKGDIAGALALAREDRFKNAYLGALLKAGLAEMAQRIDAFGVSNAKRAVEKVIGQEIAKLKRGMPILATTGSTGPFVGLFGTTAGVINAFQGMASAGAGLASISAGISEALITTAYGIGVAVVGVWSFNYFTNRTDKVTEELTSSEADFLDWAEKLVQKGGDSVAAK